jgi:hypothetical protein
MQTRLAELGGTALARSGAGKDHAAQFRKPSLNLCIDEGRVDFPVELIDHRSVVQLFIENAREVAKPLARVR